MDALTSKIAEALSRTESDVDLEVGLGIEARSILRSIQTESTKLRQFDGLSRTDRHYFRARFNYYKLSILRLREKEREVLEPQLIDFHQAISQREFETGGDPSDVQHTPFLEAVRPALKPSLPRPPMPEPTLPPGFILGAHTVGVTPSPRAQTFDTQAILSELSLMKMALKAEPTPEGQRIISDSIDRIISRLKMG